MYDGKDVIKRLKENIKKKLNAKYLRQLVSQVCGQGIL